MSRACSWNRSEEKNLQSFGSKRRSRPTGRLTNTYDNIKIDLKQMRCEVVGWFNVPQDIDPLSALVNMTKGVWES
jgi:hypothetical protein